MPTIRHRLQKIARRLGSITKRSLTAILAIGLVLLGIFILWLATLNLPDLDNFSERKISSSTKIFDRTGEIVLYDVHENVQRILVDYEEISPLIVNAMVAIEDQKFYEHPGIDVRATVRAISYTILTKIGLRNDGTIQGGSTITQQVIKNTLLNSEKRISRKMKEWFLALKLERVLTKDEIMTHYLNEVPYGGSMYGVEQGAQAFFGTTADNVTVAEAAYLAAIPNAPTYYSPYGNNREALETRKRKVINNMYNIGAITLEERDSALAEVVEFRPQEELFAKSLHFVQYVREYLETTYGKDVVENEGLRVVTTLDYELQQQAEEIVLEQALKNEELWNASNMGLVAVEPSTGHIITMVGSRDFGDDEVDGKFNIALAKRQPGSSFKPFIYATAFEQGYSDKSILFDVATQFQATCSPNDLTSNGDCYAPRNYDNAFAGPLTLRQALAQSRNIPAVKLTYLVGIQNAINVAKKLGISTLTDANRYGLTLVLGGGEVTLLEMTNAYATFANDGVYIPSTSILRVETASGEVLEEYKPERTQAISPQSARFVSSILSDNAARTPLFGSNSFLYFGNGIDVAGKTGTTNSNKDAWLVGYSTSMAVGVWSGNNDNTSMKKGSSISGAAWREFMDLALKKYPAKRFIPPENRVIGKPFMDGVALGGESFFIDEISGKLATEYTPDETKKEVIIPNIHSALHWINRSDPTGPIPTNPGAAPLYEHWETSVAKWVVENGIEFLADLVVARPTAEDDVHVPENFPEISITSLDQNETVDINNDLIIKSDIDSEYPIERVEVYVNGVFYKETSSSPYSVTISLNKNDFQNLPQSVDVRVIAIDDVYNRGEDVVTINLEN